jgi:hypothetical protein
LREGTTQVFDQPVLPAGDAPQFFGLRLHRFLVQNQQRTCKLLA